MSYVTNAILCFGAGDNGVEIVEEVNRFFDYGAGVYKENGFVHIGDERIFQRDWEGGPKVLEADIAVGAFNYLDVDKLVDYLRGMAWEWPEEAQLLVKTQDADCFRSIMVGGKEESR